MFFACYSIPYIESADKDGIIKGMNFSLQTQIHRNRRLVKCAFAVIALFSAYFFAPLSPAQATYASPVPTSFAAKTAAATTVSAQFLAPQKLSLSGTEFALSTATPSIPQTGTFNWLVAVKPSSTAKSAQIRFEVRRDSGSLVYRRTRYLNNLNKKTEKKKAPKSYFEAFNRDLTGLALYEGTYTIAVEVTVSNGTDRETASLYSTQYIYDEAREPTKWACALHFTSMPLRNAQGIFVVDPSEGTPEAQRQALSRLAALAATNKNAHITLFISPLLLEDFTAIAKGYSLKVPNATQTQAVAPKTLIPQRYAETLTALSNAVAAGQLSLGVVGYSDPNLTKISQAHMAGDIALQYNRARSSLTPLAQNNAESFETSYTAPLGTRLSKDALAGLTKAGVSGIIISDKALKNSEHTVGKVSSKLTGFVSDNSLSDMLTSNESTSISEAFFNAYQSGDGSDPLITHSVISSEEDASRVITNLELLYAQPWLAPASLTELASAKKMAELTLKTPSKTSQTTIEKAIYKARRACEGLVYALNEDVKAIKAREDSLISEFGAPVTSAQKSLADELRNNYTQEAQQAADNVFKDISVKVASVTLSGREGKVPVTIKNGTKEEVRVLLTYKTSNGMNLDTKKQQIITLPPHETFLEPTVSMRNASRGKLDLTLTAADYTICEKTVKISASYIDTIVIVVIVVVIGIALLLFIYRRVTTSDVEVNLFTSEDADEFKSEHTNDTTNEDTTAKTTD